MKLAYRPDIDGLRAIAVSVVVLYHAYPNAIKKGFIGVDMFFVISGYLITNIILRELAAGTFTLTDFYARRFKRILPAFLTVIIATIALGFFFLKPDEFANLLKHAAASLMFAENFLLLSEVDYFDRAAEYKPLLHIWSLSVEEQFYLLCPLFLMTLYKRGKILPWVMVGVVITSLVLNILMVNRLVPNATPQHAFFLLPTRLWELGMGGIAAWLALNRFESLSNFRQTIYAECISLIAFIVLILGIFSIITDRTPAIFAVFPTFALILFGEKTRLNRLLLASKPFVFIGLISYPLYLWHWSLFALIQLQEVYILIILALLLSYFTYRFIEKPLRYSSHSAFKIVLFSLAALVLSASNSILLKNTKYDTNLAEIESLEFYLIIDKLYKNTCLYENTKKNTGCASNTHKEIPHTALVGDSHSGHFYTGLAEKNLPISLLMTADCHPIKLNDLNTSQAIKNACDKANEANLDIILKNDKIHSVYFAFFQSNSFEKHQSYNYNKDQFYLELERKHAEIFNVLIRANKKVVVIIDAPILDMNPYNCEKFTLFSTLPNCNLTRARADEKAVEYNKMIKRLKVNFPKIGFYDPLHLFCDETICKAKLNDKLLYRDTDHLSHFGSRLVADDFMKWLAAQP